MVATWFLLRRSADALDALVQRLRDVDVKNLQPVSIDQPSQEILPVIREFNSVFQRASQALQTEQRFTAMAAHELRTPLAGIRAQAQLALGSDTDAERQEALQAVISAVRRASHMFDQLFDLTRLDSVGSDLGGQRQRVVFDAVFLQVMDALDARAQARHMVVHTDWQAPTFYGLEFALFLLLRNLVANAILYGPDGGRIDVSTWREEGCVVLCVDDAGKGIAEADRARAFERFNRLGQRGTEGVGLGLSIVHMVAELHGGQVALQDSPLGGLRVRVSLPDAQRPAALPPTLLEKKT
jgi:signal transduction histidine kinase